LGLDPSLPHAKIHSWQQPLTNCTNKHLIYRLLNARLSLDSWLITLEGAIDPEIERAWRQEVTKRIAELDSGAVKTVPGDEVRAKLRNIVGEV